MKAMAKSSMVSPKTDLRMYDENYVKLNTLIIKRVAALTGQDLNPVLMTTVQCKNEKIEPVLEENLS